MGDDGPVVERVGPTVRPVDELVAQDEVAGLDVALERTGGTRRDHRLHAEGAHRPDVGPVVDPVGRDRVTPAVTGEERDLPVGDGGEEERVGRGAVRGVDLDLPDVVEQGGGSADTGSGSASAASPFSASAALLVRQIRPSSRKRSNASQRVSM